MAGEKEEGRISIVGKFKKTRMLHDSSKACHFLM